MVHLDTSFLIRALKPGTREDLLLRRWLTRRDPVGLSSIAWAEFLCGPVSSEDAEKLAGLLIEPVVFGPIEATLAAALFNGSGRRRHSLSDCMIAATAVNAGATLATSNVADFKRFESQGLVLESP
jgi:predicted nucleic acid-binding protein